MAGAGEEAVSEPRTTNGLNPVRGESRGLPSTGSAGKPVLMNQSRPSRPSLPHRQTRADRDQPLHIVNPRRP
jgi:hypothetical protein